MRFSVLPILAAAAALSGCVMAVPPTTAPAPQPVRPPVAVTPSAPVTAPKAPDTAIARQVVSSEMAKRLPGRNVGPLTDCVISGATMAELADLAAMQGTAGAGDAVAAMIQRPGTSQCIARASVA